ncbi:Replication protein C C-terminal region [Rhizobium tibeticum]|uniref:Replication initiation protein RepC n=1 Tax=Rhizobium tibeticum TaxID=501024 RepID=A0A1H8TBZ1_9HYPH|nr:replication initiation protein RepC [Rhizobium tibeticum]SEO88018.1 Replication protein C C-terminal region [Rhizobium tibeticum]
MQSGNVTTPFGRRPMTLAFVKGQLETAERNASKSVDKWKVFRDVCEAKDIFGLQNRSLAVLHALLSFYPDTDLSDENGLVVFPSNAQLSIRAHGIAGTTLRRHLAALVDAGLIQRRDSPNGKRYALREEIVNLLEIQLKAEKMDGNAVHDIQNSKPDSIHELEPSSEQEQGEKPRPEPRRIAEPLKAFPLSMVLRACSQMADFAPGGRIDHWRELMSAAVVVRSMLGVSPSAYQEACEVMGPDNAGCDCLHP